MYVNQNASTFDKMQFIYVNTQDDILSSLI